LPTKGSPADLSEDANLAADKEENKDARVTHDKTPISKIKEEARTPDIGPLRQKALLGDAKAMDLLGLAFNHGYGIKADNKAAILWFLNSAVSGNEMGQLHLAVPII
jgi:hypothetical protein